jgi:hypothetical protein
VPNRRPSELTADYAEHADVNPRQRMNAPFRSAAASRHGAFPGARITLCSTGLAGTTRCVGERRRPNLQADGRPPRDLYQRDCGTKGRRPAACRNHPGLGGFPIRAIRVIRGQIPTALACFANLRPVRVVALTPPSSNYSSEPIDFAPSAHFCGHTPPWSSFRT